MAIEQIVKTLKARQPRTNPSFTGPRASVLIPLSEDEAGRCFVWFTKRTAHLRSNPNEVSFPGGKKEESDQSDWDVALRESNEEIGLKYEDVTFVAQLDPLMSRFGMLVTAFVGVIPHNFVPIMNEAEVSSVFRVPLDFFLTEDPSFHRVTEWFDPETKTPGLSHYFYVEDQIIWGLTVSFLLHFLDASNFAPIPYLIHARDHATWFDRSLLPDAKPFSWTSNSQSKLTPNKL